MVPDFYSETRSFPRKLLLFDRCRQGAVLLMLNQRGLVPAGLQLPLQYMTHEERKESKSCSQICRMLLCVNICNVCPSSSLLRRAITVLPNVF